MAAGTEYLLHGIIQATIFEATFSAPPFATREAYQQPIRKTVSRQFKKRFSWVKRRLSFCQPQIFEDIEVNIGKGSENLYATVDVKNARLARTRVIRNEPLNPRWNESFHVYCAHHTARIVFTVKSEDAVGATLIGRAYLPVPVVLNGEIVNRSLAIYNGDKIIDGAKIHVQLQFVGVSYDPTSNWGKGIGNPNFPGVPHTFFPQRQGCKVTLYQDSHVARSFNPRIAQYDGKYYEPRKCWEDVFDAINYAQQFIYITGWSVNATITLIRDPQSRVANRQGDAVLTLTLGELLKRKAQEGVRVLLLVWNDRTSVGLGPIKKDGLMATHDQDTASYFRDTGVHCVLCPRNPDEGGSYVQDLEVATMFTHHQKTVITDCGSNRNAKRWRRTTRNETNIVSFVGGIDLCDGRYDTQDHPLFQTLNTTHRDDFHQPNFSGSSRNKGGPREPWHDIHCRIEGRAAWDVLRNFEQRWKKQGSGDNLLIPLDYPTDVEDRDIPTEEEDRDTWNVQVFRSIDGGAVVGFPDDPKSACSLGLVTGKNQVIERSIQDAYIHAIRRAKNFIYIENQYFLGSSYAWRPNDGIKVDDIGALHLIPRELSLKITQKIEAGERFSVYIVIPMWPEGIPESASVQAILDWQRRTMEMMYSDITIALRSKGIAANPKDYLSFFCLGNREMYRSGEYEPPERPEPGTDYRRAQQARRFMIYVHAKMMIVDDEYIIIGSANINERSMNGGRDSEIAMGAYQPNHLTTNNQMARGQIHNFRMSLWFEHLKLSDNAFLQPKNLDCIRKVNQIADQYWDLYASSTLQRDLPGHLLSYPIILRTNSANGEVTLLPKMEFFPDTKASILGRKSDYLPSILTT